MSDRVNGKNFCKKCEYYYSEFFTCPICYGEKIAEERIIKLLEEHDAEIHRDNLIALIKGEQN